MYTYLLIDIFTLAFPLTFSRSERFGFGRNWKYAWWAVAGSAAPFLIWDFVFTQLGVWSFNPKYILGIHLGNLPLEEVFFFFAIPFACLFIYQQVRGKPRLQVSPALARKIWGVLSVILAATATLYMDRLYTFYACLLGAITALSLATLRPKYSGPLLVAILIQYLPFLVVNGLLTYLPVVQYNSAALIGWHIGSIPIEDTVYSFVMLVGPVALFEFFSKEKP